MKGRDMRCEIEQVQWLKKKHFHSWKASQTYFTCNDLIDPATSVTREEVQTPTMRRANNVAQAAFTFRAQTKRNRKPKMQKWARDNDDAGRQRAFS